MNSNPFVSVFIPAYNAEPFVQQAIDSVLAQTYSNYELIIINDASTDNTAKMVNQYQGHSRVKIYHNPTNLGVTGNWNRGIALSQGDFIVRLDADDYYTPNYLEKVMVLFKQFSELDMVFTSINLIFGDGKTRLELPYKDTWIKTGAAFLPEITRFCPIRAPSVCLKRTCYERLGGVMDDLRIHHDWELWVRIAAHNNNIGYIAEPLTYYRVLNPIGCTSGAIINATSPVDCDTWLKHLAANTLSYQLNDNELLLLKQGMYDIVMAFAVFAMENDLTESVEKHLAFARKILPPGVNDSMQARLYARAAEIYFMEGEHYFKGWKSLLQSLRFGLPPRENNKHLKLWARTFLGKTIFEFVREHTVARRKFPYNEV